MESFPITVDLKSFFNDFRRKSVIFVDTNSMIKVEHVVRHIQRVFGIQADTIVFSLDNFVPGAEDSRVLKTLPSIRLETQTLSTTQNNRENANEDCELRSTTNSKGPDSDTNQTTQSGHSSKKKKHKRKRVDKDDGCENPSNEQVLLDDVSFISNGMFSILDNVTEKKSKKRKSLATELDVSQNCDQNDKRPRNDCPNEAFYGKSYDNESKNVEKIEVSQKRKRHSESVQDTDISNNTSTPNLSCGNKSKVEELVQEFFQSDTSISSDVLISKPKRKRIRKRKKSPRSGPVPQETEFVAPQCFRNPMYETSKLLKPNSNHIYFSEEVLEELPKEVPGEKSVDNNLPVENLRLDASLNGSDSKTEVKEPEVEEKQRVLLDLPETAELNNESNPSEYSVQNKGMIDHPRVLENPVKHTGINLPQAKKDFGGLGKLLSMLRDGNAPVFERKKVMTTKNLPNTPNQQTTAPAFIPSASQNKQILTPLKTIPEVNTKISFRIMKLSASYCPEFSNVIVATVKNVDRETQELLLHIIEGVEECQTVRGKFDVDPEAELEERDKITLNWQDLIEPSKCS